LIQVAPGFGLNKSGLKPEISKLPALLDSRLRLRLPAAGRRE